jgi:hypothetical protein
MKGVGVEIRAISNEAFAVFTAAERERWRKTIAALNLKIE